MKWKLYILLFGFIVFLSETVSIPYVAKASSKTNTCCKMHNMAANAGGPKKSCPKESKKSMNCLDCPLCYLVVATPMFSKDFVLPEFRKNKYLVFINTGLSTYNDKTWKPPDSQYLLADLRNILFR